MEVEGTGETVGEAKWAALRELERLAPGLDKAQVQFQVVSEGERGLLGVGYAPARVIARLDELPEEPGGALVARVREVMAEVSSGLELDAAIAVREDDETVYVTLTGGDLGRLIGRHGQTIDALQYLVNAIVLRSELPETKPVVVDAAGYRARREATLTALADRTADQVRATGEEAALEPMTAVERKIVHLRLKELGGVETRSEGTEPNRYVIVAPADEARHENGTDA
ncbi:MAG: RNA-binding cell elongation regulator Jag/EloR [Gaiellaceae bacterium]